MNLAWKPSRIVCGVDGSRGSDEAVRQAVALAAGGARLELVHVAWATGHGPTAMAVVAPTRARAALDRAARLAADAGVAAERRVLESSDPPGALLDAAAGADLLVLGTEKHSRAGGIVLGQTATEAAHRSACDLLVARPLRGEHQLGGQILLAFDGSPSAQRAAAITAAIARSHEGRVTIVTLGRAAEEHRHETAEAVVSLTEATGHEPVVVGGDGDAHVRIVELAEELRATLVVLGSRRLSGVRALGSVSERVAHAARCSVLIARAPAGAP